MPRFGGEPCVACHSLHTLGHANDAQVVSTINSSQESDVDGQVRAPLKHRSPTT